MMLFNNINYVDDEICNFPSLHNVINSWINNFYIRQRHPLSWAGVSEGQPNENYSFLILWWKQFYSSFILSFSSGQGRIISCRNVQTSIDMSIDNNRFLIIRNRLRTMLIRKKNLVEWESGSFIPKIIGIKHEVMRSQ